MAQEKWRKRAMNAAIAFVTTIVVVSGIGIPSLDNQSTDTSAQYQVVWSRSDSAIATSGGRSGGGSFGSSGGSSGSNSSGSSSGSLGSSSSSSSSYSGSYDGSSSSSTSAAPASPTERFIAIAVFFLIGASIILNLVYSLVSAVVDLFQKITLRLFHPAKYRANQERSQAIAATKRELCQRQAIINNDVVTITQIQVALSATARDVQKQLNNIATETDWNTPAGVQQGLQETALTLLRASDSWTHVSTQSKTVSTRERATKHFEQLSIEERSKFDVESLVNIDGKLTRKDIIKPKEKESADYIVVTLIIGTAHDEPLLQEILSDVDLKIELKGIATISPDYLMTYEMLWSPQDESDSLTYEELLLNYPYMIQIC